MKIVDSNVELLEQAEGLRGIYKQIEKCGRTCYKSEDKITEDSCERFVQAMIKNGHTAMLEHGTVYLTIPDDNKTVPTKYLENPYTKVVHDDAYYITTNYRVIVQNHWEDDLIYLSEPTAYHIKRYCFRITCDRGVSHEIVRHRKMSFAQESTRYCNYNKDKFGGEITYIRPHWAEIPVGKVYWYDGINWRIQRSENPEDFLSVNPRNMPEEMAQNISSMFNLFSNAEGTYKSLIKRGVKAESARCVLPNALKTEICVTGFEDDWNHFLNLRYKGTTGKPHPDMYKVAEQINNILHG